MGRLGWNFLGESCLRENIWYFSPKKKHRLFICFLGRLHVLHLFYVFLKPACGSIEKPRKKGATKSTRSKIANSQDAKVMHPPVEKKPKKRSAKKQHSLKARMRLYLFGQLRLDEWFSIRASDFLGILYIWKKGESKICSYCFLIMPSPTFLPLAYSTGIWLSFSWLHKPWCPMYDPETTHYPQHCNIVAWQMAGLLHPHETCCFLRPVVVIFCWYLVSEKKSTNNARDATNTMV